MRVTIGRRGDTYCAYVAKKDLEEAIVDMEHPELWGGWVDLANGWRLGLPEMEAETRLPVTVIARRINGDRA
jgi:nitrogen fixation protein NifT